MPDNKKGRSNKAMTFFCLLSCSPGWITFGPDIGVIAGALPFITDEFQITPHSGMGGEFDDVWCCRGCRRQRLALLQTGA